MAEKSSIQWTQATWNPWHGCKKVSPGCKYCYMYRDKEKYGQDPTLVLRSKTKFNDPLKWKDPRIIFTCSWSDWFIDLADEWRAEAWAIIKATPWHTYQILTKRADRILENLPADWGNGYPNVWLGVSVEDQEQAIKRIPYLMKVPAAVRFLSCEPLLEEIDITNKGIKNGYSVPTGYDHMGHGIEWTDPGPGFVGVDWVIVGGESGNDNGKYLYRPFNNNWAEKIIKDCKGQTPVFIKQLGTYVSKAMGLKDRHGGVIEEWPAHLQVRYMPLKSQTI